MTGGEEIGVSSVGPSESRIGISVFLSYRPEDAESARGLGLRLERVLGATVFTGPPGRRKQEIRAALESVDVLLLLLGSPTSRDKSSVTQEAGDELSDSQTFELASALSRGRPVIPVLLERSAGIDLHAVLGEETRRRAVYIEDVDQLVDHLRSLWVERRPSTARRTVSMLPPSQVRAFLDRVRELQTILDYLAPVGEPAKDDRARVLQIVGPGGVGKSALAVRAAHEAAELFPDGQLYARLGEPGSEAEALRGFLTALGFDRRDLPESVYGMAALYHAALSDRRVLVFLDDVESVEAVMPLLPRVSTCAALLTGRVPLSIPDSADAYVLSMQDGLPMEHALALLRASAGREFADENPELATELVEAVGGMPLALQLVAAQVRTAGVQSWSSLGAGLKTLNDDNVRQVLLKRVYQGLPEAQQRLFRLLAALPMSEFEPGLVAALAGTDEDSTGAALRDLVDLVLLELGADGRFRLGDAVAKFAADRLAVDEPEEQRQAAIGRAIRWIAVQTAFQPETPLARDFWTADDNLGYGKYADAIVAFIRHRGTLPPLTIGVKGPWGAGKTSLMRMVQERLDPRADRARWTPMSLQLSDDTREVLAPGLGTHAARRRMTNRELLQRSARPPEDVDSRSLDVQPPTTPRLAADDEWRPTVWFNPWMYQNGEQIWAGLAYEIITQITDRLAPGDRERFWLALNLRRVDGQALRRRVYRQLLERFLPWLLGLGLAAVLAIAGLLVSLVIPPAAAALRLAAAVLLSGSGTAFGVGAIVSTARFLRAKAASSFAPLLRMPDPVKVPAGMQQETKGALDDVMPDPGYKSRLGFLHLVHTDMRRVLDLVATERRPLVVFVDDLDRCAPGAVVQVIEALNLFLAGEFPNCIFILAMEPAVVAAHVETVYKDLASHSRPGRPAKDWSTLGWRFLEKIVQLPLSLPPPDSPAHLTYLNSLLDQPPSVARQRGDESGHPQDSAVRNPAAATDPSVPANDTNGTGGQRADGTDAVADQSGDAARANRVRELEAAIRRRSPTAQTVSTAALQAQAEVLDTTASQLLPEAAEAANRVFVELYSDNEARAAILAGVPGLASDNPREIKRFVNLFRFYSFISQQHQLQGRPPTSAAQIAKLAVLAIRWPSLLAVIGLRDADNRATALGYLEESLRAELAGDTEFDDAWYKALCRVGLMPDGDDRQLYQAWAQQFRGFLATEPSIAAAAERML